MKLTFITTNKHKFEEVAAILQPYAIEVEHLSRSYAENHDESMEEIVRAAATSLCQELGRPITLEDTGLFFTAYPGFPGALPKFVITTLGYKGIFNLLTGESRHAYFKTVAALAIPGEPVHLFTGLMHGHITDLVFDASVDCMPYDRIFIPVNETKPISSLTMSQKNELSQRAAAYRRLGDYLKAR